MATIDLSETVEGADTQMASTSSPEQSPLSLLSILRAPTQSNLMRKWKVRTNELPHTGTQKKPPCSTDPKRGSAAQRAREFSGEIITFSAGKLFVPLVGRNSP